MNAREAYRQDHHRNLFGTDSNTPFEKGNKKVGNQWSTSMKSGLAGESQGQGGAAGSQSVHTQNQFGSTRDTGAGYSGI